MALPENRDMQIVSFEHFAPSDISIAAQMAKIKDSKPDVVMAWGTGTATATEYRGAQRCRPRRAGGRRERQSELYGDGSVGVRFCRASTINTR